MHTTNLRKIGGSVMLAVPSAILELLQLQVGATVGMAVDHGSLVVEPRPRPRYNLNELLARCDVTAEPTADDRGSWRGRSGVTRVSLDPTSGHEQPGTRPVLIVKAGSFQPADANADRAAQKPPAETLPAPPVSRSL